MRPSLFFLAVAACIVPDEATAGAGKTSFVYTQELHATQDGLDSVIVLPDRHRATSVSIGHAGALGPVAFSAKADYSQTRYLRYAFEDDTSAGLSLSASGKPGGGVELRGSIGYAYSDEGDDLVLAVDGVPIGALGIRTATHTVSAGGEIGVDLGGGRAFVATVSAQGSFAGETEFAGGVLPPLQIEADYLRPKATLSLRQTIGPQVVGVSAGLRMVRAGGVADAGLLSLDLASLAVDYAYEHGAASVVGSVGLQALRGAVIDEWRPAYRVALKLPAGPRLKLSGSVAGAFEIDDTDDPLASWKTRGEIEAVLALTGRLAFGVGLFSQRLYHLVLDETERSRGAYAEFEYRANGHLTFVLRGDVERIRSPLFMSGKERGSAFLSVRAAL